MYIIGILDESASNNFFVTNYKSLAGKRESVNGFARVNKTSDTLFAIAEMRGRGVTPYMINHIDERLLTTDDKEIVNFVKQYGFRI